MKEQLFQIFGNNLYDIVQKYPLWKNIPSVFDSNNFYHKIILLDGEQIKIWSLKTNDTLNFNDVEELYQFLLLEKNKIRVVKLNRLTK